MAPPSEILRGVAAILAPGLSPGDLEAFPLSGGSIHPAVRVRLRGSPGGPEAFLKWWDPAGTGGLPGDQGDPFRIEAEGLEALRSRGGPRVPHVLGVGDAWLLLEYLPPAPPARDTGRRLGAALAHLHRPLGSPDGRPPLPGWARNGWIGSLPQRNAGGPPEWPTFWRDLRLEPQIERAHPRLPPPVRSTLGRLLDRMDEALAGWEEDGLSLLHGDLWAGNVLTTHGGEPALVDPAVYRGHREVDLAMMELFGGFEPEVLTAYRDRRPLRPGYRRLRSHVYRLYPLLVHLNLFGGAYLAGVRQAAGRALGELGEGS